MSLRFLLGVLAPALPTENNQNISEGINISENEGIKSFDTIIVDFQTPAKFHLGMLSISLITGLAFAGLIAYNCWSEKNIFLSYIRNLVIALTCRTFFSIIFDGSILLGAPLNVGGGNALLAFEQIFLNLVLAFWITLTIYIHARVQRNFNSEPNLRLYQYGVPGVAAFFAFVWIFTLQDQWPSVVWWIFINPITQWIVNSINILFLFIQLMLVVDIARMMMKTSLDNDSVSLLRKAAIMMGVLVLIFWFQFGFTIGRVPLKNSSSYVYFFYFIDGLECALVCLTLYFFNKWVLTLLNKLSSIMTALEEPLPRTPKPKEILLTGSGGQGIVTIDSVFMTNENEKWENLEKEGTKDVVYSNIVGQQRLKKTLELYKRLNIIPTNPVTVIDGEEFYDCPFLSTAEDSEKIKLSPKQLQSLVADVSKQKILSTDTKFENDKVCEQTQKKNAFYSSKYLILDSKDSDIPKYLETCPSVSSISGRKSLKEERKNENLPSTLNSLMPDEMVLKWLNDNAGNMQEKNEKTKHEKIDSKMSKRSAQKISDSSLRQNEDQTNALPEIVSKINSVVSGAIFRSSNKEGKSLSKEKHLISNDKEQNDSITSSKSSNLELRFQEKTTLTEATANLATTTSKKKDKILFHENDIKKPAKAVKLEANEILKSKQDTKSTADSSVPETLTSKLPTIKTTSTNITEEGKIKATSTDAEVSDAKDSLEKPLNQYLTYSELLEFRSQQAKTNINQPNEATNNYFSWSGAISFTIGSLISTGGSFFSSSKNFSNTAKAQEIENSENATAVKMRVSQEDNSVLQTEVELETKRFSVESNQTIENNSDKGGYELISSEELTQTQTNNAEAATRKKIYTPTDVPDKAPSDSSFEFEVSQEALSVKIADTAERTSQDVIPRPLTQEDTSSTKEPSKTNYPELLNGLKADKLTADQPIQAVIEQDENMEVESKRIDVKNRLTFENESKNFWTKPCNDFPRHETSSKDSPDATDTMKNKLTEEQMHKFVKDTVPEIIQPLNPAVDQETQDEQIEIPGLEFQSNRFDLTKNELIFQCNTEKFSPIHHQIRKTNKQKLFRKPLLGVSESETPVIVKSTQESRVVEKSPNNNINSASVSVIPEKQVIIDTSSESEFSIEKKALSSSSDETSDSFSLEKYYAELMDTSTKFSDQPSPLKKYSRSQNLSLK